SPLSLTPYNEDTTQINFFPLDRNRTLTPPLVNISLTPPIQTPDFQIFPSTPSTNTSNQRYFNLNFNPRTTLTNLLNQFTPTTNSPNRNLPIPGNYPQVNLISDDTLSSHYTPQYSPPPYQPTNTTSDLSESTNPNNNLVDRIVQILDDLHIDNNYQTNQNNQEEYNLDNFFTEDNLNNNLEAENQEDSDLESINIMQDEVISMAVLALQEAATAMTELARALGTSSEKTLFKIESFRDDRTQDPITWLESFEQAAKANRWNAIRQLELASAYLTDNAQEWLQSLVNAPTHFKHQQHGQRVNGNYVHSFYHLFRERFCTTQQKATWQKQLFAIQQGTDTVDTYVNKFKQLKERVD